MNTETDSNQNAEHMKGAANEAVTKLKGVASDAKAAASDAVDSGKAYAKAAVDATGKKLRGANSYLSDSCEAVTDAINREPVKAVLVTAAFTAALTALVIAALQSSERRYY